MKIAIASCGLGHIHRGIEVWARDLAYALHDRGLDVMLFKGGGLPDVEFERVLPCVPRTSRRARWLSGFGVPGLWRTRFGSPYKMESHTFASSLIRELDDSYDIVHIQDPVVADLLLKARREGNIRAAVLFADGTEEPIEARAEFDFLQELDPFGLEELSAGGYEKPGWFSVPNFVDAEMFRPGDRLAARKRLGIPGDAFAVLSVGAVQRAFKRMDYLIEEYAAFHDAYTGKTHLLIGGASTAESADLERHARDLVGNDFSIRENVEHDAMAALYQAADVFVFCVTHGIYGIALAEAAATGLPCIVHNWKRVKWVAGPDAMVVDMTKKGAVTKALAALTDESDRERRGDGTRAWAEQNISKAEVIPLYIEMYRSIQSQLGQRRTGNRA